MDMLGLPITSMLLKIEYKMADGIGTSTCSVCGKKVKNGEKGILCDNKCGRWFHKACIKMSNARYEEFAANDKSWNCEREDCCSTINLQQLQASLIKMEKQIGIINEKTEKITASVQFYSDSFDEIMSKLKKLESRIISTESLTNKISSMNEELENVEAYLRRNNLEIFGIPEKKEEDLYEVVCKMTTALNVQLKREDIDIVHRLPTRNQEINKPIVLKLVNRWKRQEILNEKKKKRLNLGDIGFNDKGMLFINEHLTPQAKALYKRARDMRNKGFMYAWVKEGKIFLRKNEHERVVHVKNNEIMKELEQSIK